MMNELIIKYPWPIPYCF